MTTERHINETTVRVLKGDISALDVEAFVFYARPDLRLGTGEGTAIAQRGGPKIQEELTAIGVAPVGSALLTAAGELKAKHIIHAVGPAFQEQDTEGKLQRTLESVFARAEEAGLQQLALPSMGTGFYGIPIETSAAISLRALQAHLEGTTSLKEVTFCVRDSDQLAAFSRHLQAIRRNEDEQSAAIQ